MERKIIAESGGSKTSWCIENQDGSYDCFEGSSLHPIYWDELEKRLPPVILEHKSRSTSLHFFGAGCFQPERQKELKSLFAGLGFPKIHVKGDVEAAALACLYQQNGWVCILGSGSVLCKVNQGSVIDIYGGHGEMDDFGSGYRFGRMLQEAFRSKELDFLLSKEYPTILEAETKEEFLALSKEVPFELSENIHRKNLELFVTNLTDKLLSKGETLHFVGGYAYFHQKLIEELLQNRDYQAGKFIVKPIEQLIHVL